MTKEREERQNRARELWSEGKNVREICDIMGLAYQTICNYVCEMPDWEERKKKSKRTEIEAMILAGYDNAEIAEVLNVCKKTVSMYRTQLGSNVPDQPREDTHTIPSDFLWKWPATVNRLLKVAGKTTQPVPEHSQKAERQWFTA